jgi:hypothetical protein
VAIESRQNCHIAVAGAPASVHPTVVPLTPKGGLSSVGHTPLIVCKYIGYCPYSVGRDERSRKKLRTSTVKFQAQFELWIDGRIDGMKGTNQTRIGVNVDVGFENVRFLTSLRKHDVEYTNLYRSLALIGKIAGRWEGCPSLRSIYKARLFHLQTKSGTRNYMSDRACQILKGPNGKKFPLRAYARSNLYLAVPSSVYLISLSTSEV